MKEHFIIIQSADWKFYNIILINIGAYVRNVYRTSTCKQSHSSQRKQLWQQRKTIIFPREFECRKSSTAHGKTWVITLGLTDKRDNWFSEDGLLCDDKAPAVKDSERGETNTFYVRRWIRQNGKRFDAEDVRRRPLISVNTTKDSYGRFDNVKIESRCSLSVRGRRRRPNDFDTKIPEGRNRSLTNHRYYIILFNLFGFFFSQHRVSITLWL